MTRFGSYTIIFVVSILVCKTFDYVSGGNYDLLYYKLF